MQETQVQSLGWEDPLEKGMSTHSSILTWRIPWTEGPGGLQSVVSHRVGHNWSDLASTHASCKVIFKGQYTSFNIGGEIKGWKGKASEHSFQMSLDYRHAFTETHAFNMNWGYSASLSFRKPVEHWSEENRTWMWQLWFRFKGFMILGKISPTALLSFSFNLWNW